MLTNVCACGFWQTIKNMAVERVRRSTVLANDERSALPISWVGTRFKRSYKSGGSVSGEPPHPKKEFEYCAGGTISGEIERV